MKCVVIDDDKVSRLLIEKYISKTNFLELVGSYENPVNAINDDKISDLDLIFIDIEMPEMTGIEFMKNFKNLPSVIVISGKDKYAIESLDLDAVDYLLKPIEYPRFFKAVTKIKEYRQNRHEPDYQKFDKGIFIKDGSSSLIRLKYNEIVWIEALENYVLIMTDELKHTIHFTMKSLENQLPEDKFIRIHRSFIINIEKIDAIEDNYVIITFAGKKKSFPIAKSFRDNLLTKIKIISK
jgi:DNA-binding LytR/AlgR family response regulator